MIKDKKMDSEKNIRIMFTATLLLFFLGWFFREYFFNYDVVLGVITLGIILLSFEIFETHIRVQHNIDNKVKDLEKLLIEKSNELIVVQRDMNKIATDGAGEYRKINDNFLESVKHSFMMKNDISFKLLSFKHDIEKEFKEIKESQQIMLERSNDIYAKNSKTLKVYWYKSNNFGDRLSSVIVEHFSGKKVEFAESSQAHKFLGVGSMLGSLKEGDVVWGTGLISEAKIKAPSGVKFLAVRGPLTRSLIDGNVPEIYGDPGILMPLIYNPKIEKTNMIGIMPHYADKEVWEGKVLPEEEKFIDIEGYWKKIIDELLSCESVHTSSLHGIIVCQAYGIPVVWEKYSDNIIGGEFKFQDYFLGSGQGRKKIGDKLLPLDNLAEKQKVLINALRNYYG